MYCFEVLIDFGVQFLAVVESPKAAENEMEGGPGRQTTKSLIFGLNLQNRNRGRGVTC